MPFRMASSTTSVLAQRWRHLWIFSPGICFAGVKGWSSVDNFRRFVDRLLHLRQESVAPLESCCFELDLGDDGSGSVAPVRLIPREWILLALRCKVRVLRFCGSKEGFFCLDSDDVALVSETLTRIEFSNFSMRGSVLDFSGCTALVDLKAESSNTSARQRQVKVYEMQAKDSRFMK
ncbi:hypothetical protein EJB05_28904, partial [Eragrostis curvula]